MTYFICEGDTVKQAYSQMLTKAASEGLSSDQIQLVSKEVVKKGLFKSKTSYRMTFGIMENLAHLKKSQNSQSPSLFPVSENSDQSTPAKSFRRTPAPESKNPDELENKVQNLEQQVDDLKGFINDQFENIKDALVSGAVSSERDEEKKILMDVEAGKTHIRWIEDYLRERDFSSVLISDIVDYLQTQKRDVLREKTRILTAVRDFLKRSLITEDISLDDYQFGKIVLLAGPTGVGKTVTLVKMAAHLAAMRQKSMRFISVDRYKVGADSQLKEYCDLMQTPFYPINKQEDFFEILDREETDYTFIDTAGRSPRDTIAINELSGWIKRTKKRMDVHLVITAGTKPNDLEFLMEKFGVLGFEHILATKLDETQFPGSILSLVYQSGKPLSFLTNGQEVPQDFEIANVDKLIDDALK